MGIYDVVNQAYQHGVDQQVQLAQQPMTLAQSILGGYQQGRQLRHMGFQEQLAQDQFAEQKRHAQEQERLSQYGMDQRFESQAQAREAKARIEANKLAYRQQADAARNSLMQQANDLRAKGLENDARMIEARIKQIDTTIAEIEKQSDAKLANIQAQTWGIYNRPEMQQGMLGFGTVSQERDLFSLLRAAIQGDVAQRNADVRDTAGGLGVVERPERVSPTAAIDNLDIGTLFKKLEEFRKGQPPAGGAKKIIEKSKKVTSPKPPAAAKPTPAAAPQPSASDLPPGLEEF